MKTLLKFSIGIIFLGLLSFVLANQVSSTQDAKNDHRNCFCSSLTCECGATCLDVGEIPVCECSIWSCKCTCDEKMVVPTQNPRQLENSQKLKITRLHIALAMTNQRSPLKSREVIADFLYLSLP